LLVEIHSYSLISLVTRHCSGLRNTTSDPSRNWTQIKQHHTERLQANRGVRT